ncbi:MAG: aspartate carbamoyltransferase catalytic subunit [Peptococcaceae bacterium]|jgi:aspartate carbamoyltransferase catalytic subunit|nr:aspartate carbamoyltransferase catalytic subunit [Peptococcaceae bacterium]
MKWNRKDLLGLREVSAAEIRHILKTAKPMKEILFRSVKKLPTLRGKSVVTLFFENSTRTRVSFEIAGKVLGADTSSVAVAQSSVAKGESLLDTAKTIQAMQPDVVIMRHSSSGAAEYLANLLKVSVINAGDGQQEHPTQALLDIFTMQERLGDVAGRKVVIVGDILHSRVARSNAYGLLKLGAEVTFVGPPTLLPPEMKALGVRVTHDLESALPGADAVMALRLQLERQQRGLLPTLREYSKLYGLNLKRLALTGKDTLVLHPGPMNRGVEIDSALADSTYSVIEEQVTNGVAVRMALIYLLAGGGNTNDVA